MLKKFLQILCFASLSFALAACSNLTVPESSDTLPHSGERTMLSGRIYQGELPPPTPSRTAFPTFPDATDLTYEVSAALKTNPSTTATGTVAGSTYSIMLSQGRWNVTINAKDSGGKTIFTATEEINIAGSVTKDFVLKIASEGSEPGSVSLSIGFDSTTAIASVKMQLDSETPVTKNASDLAADGTLKTAIYENASVTAGAHTLQVTFLDSAGKSLYFLQEKVNVYPGFETNKFYGNSSYISDGKIAIDQTLLNQAALTVIYVKNEGDANGTGSFFNPVNTLAKAASIVNTSVATPPPTEGFKIILLTGTTETAPITLDAGKTVTIQSSQEGSVRTVSASSATVSLTTEATSAAFEDIRFSGLQGFSVQQGSVSMQNGGFTGCSATDGGAVSVVSGAQFEGTGLEVSSCSATNGGAFYSQGDVTLTGCTIQSCTANKGGAIYAEGTAAATATVELTDCTIGAVSPTAVPTTQAQCTANGGNYSAGGAGAIMLGNYSSLTSTDSKLNGNFAVGTGGAVNAAYSDTSVQITGGEICYNNANSNGGGLNIYSTQGAGSYVKNTKIQNNKASGNGGGISVTTGKYFTVESCTEFSGNTATLNGDGCYAAGNLTLKGETYIADKIYLNTKNSPLSLDAFFSPPAGTPQMVLTYNTNTDSGAPYAADDTLLQGSAARSLTEEQCQAFTLTAEDDNTIQYDTSGPKNVGKLASPSTTTVLEVGTGKTYATIEEALAAITDTSREYEIKVSSDLTLTRDLNINKPNVTITTDNAGRPTIDGDSKYRINVTADNVTIDKIDFEDLKGGINIASGGSLTINNSTIEDGIANFITSDLNYAAGITVASGATLTSTGGLVIDDCDNTTSGNGHSGIFNNGGTVDLKGATIKNCDNNSASGGGIYTCASTSATDSNIMRLENCIITDNYGTYGGGIYCYGTEIQIKGGEISENTTAYGGGAGVYVNSRLNFSDDTYRLGKFIMEDDTLVIKDNTINGGGEQGGGIFVASGQVKLYLNTTKDRGNRASATGGGNLCYISNSPDPGTTILSGSNINGTSYSEDTVLTGNVIEN